MARGKPLSPDAREMVYKVYLYFSIEATKFKTSDGYFQRVQNRVAAATGVSKKFVYKLIKDMDLPSWQEASLKKLTEAMNRIEENEDDPVEIQPENDETGSSTNTLNYSIYSDPVPHKQIQQQQQYITVRKRQNSPLPRDLHNVSKIVKSVEQNKPKTVNIMPKIVSVHQVQNEEPSTSYSIINTVSPVPALVPIQPNTQKELQYLPSGSNLIKITTVPNITRIQPRYELQNVQLRSKLITLVPGRQNSDAAHIFRTNQKQIIATTSTGKLYSEVPATKSIQHSKWVGLIKKTPPQQKVVIKRLQNTKPKVAPKPKNQEYIQVEAKTVPIEFDPIFTNNEVQIKAESIEILD